MLVGLALMIDWLADHGGWLGKAKEVVGAFKWAQLLRTCGMAAGVGCL
jgi:hypothetical protein